MTHCSESSRSRFAFVLAAATAAATISGSVPAQVVSTQPTAELGGSSFAASSRLQHGALVPPNYEVGVVGNVGLNPGFSAQITSALTEVITSPTGQQGIAVGTSPSFWNSLIGTATFSVQFIQAGPPGEGVLIVMVNGPGFATPVVLADYVNFSGAQGVNLNFLGGGGAFYGGLVLTSGAVPPVSLGPSGNWSGTSLSNSTLTGWDFTQNWTLDGSMRFFPGTGVGEPRLQFDILNQGLAYQLSDQGTDRPDIVNYGSIQGMLITAREFQQARFGGTDGVIPTRMFSRAAVTFDLATGETGELAGGVLDLQGVPNVEPSDFGEASIIKAGGGTLVLSGANACGGGASVIGGTLALRRSASLATGGLALRDATLRFVPDAALGAGHSIAVSGNLSLNAAASLESNLSLVPDASGAPGLLSCDRIAVAGAAVLGGNVRLVLDLRLCDEPLIPPPGETRRWVPIDCSAANSATGAPSSVTLRVIGEDGHPEDLALAVNASVVADGVRFDTIAGPAGLAVSVTRDVPACAGDLDGNGSIDGADLSTLLAAWGPAPTPRPEDLNADGQVDGADLTTLLAGWGACG